MSGDSWRLSRTVLASLVACGVEDFVLCPGSRNTPLSISLVRAGREGQIQLHRRMDERVAGFLALGVAKVKGACAVVVTSGSAVGNLLPAVMEAHASGVCLVVISADRPATLIGARSNQTTNQSGIFGAHCVHAANLYSSDANPAAWAAQTRRALISGLGLRTSRSGPVQLNLGLDVPLLPGEGGGEQDGLGRLIQRYVADFELPAARPPICEKLDYVPGTVVLAGDASPEVGRQAARVAERAGLPLFAEPSSNARRSPNAVWNYVPQLAAGRDDEINRVLVYGHPTLSRPVTKLLSGQERQIVAVGEHADYPDPGLAVNAVVDAVSLEPDSSGWLGSWLNPENQSKPSRAQSFVEEFLAAAPNNVFFGSSNSIRYADAARSWPETNAYANRGLAGIDGAIATAGGIALASGQPTAALIGDLTFLYDAGALLIPAGQPEPDLRVVVLDDDGGAIFRSLEVGAPDFEDVFGEAFAMPHGHDLAAIAAGYGLSSVVVSSPQELRDALSKPICGVGIVVVRLYR